MDKVNNIKFRKDYRYDVLSEFYYCSFCFNGKYYKIFGMQDKIAAVINNSYQYDDFLSFKKDVVKKIKLFIQESSSNK